jgi:hypothetical protein
MLIIMVNYHDQASAELPLPGLDHASGMSVCCGGGSQKQQLTLTCLACRTLCRAGLDLFPVIPVGTSPDRHHQQRAVRKRRNSTVGQGRSETRGVIQVHKLNQPPAEGLGCATKQGSQGLPPAFVAYR